MASPKIPNDVVVNRGWFGYDYLDLETLPQFGTYGVMDGTIYAQLEGNNQISGVAEGGFTSTTYTPSGAGKVLAVAEVSADNALSGPVVVEIVSAYDNQVVAHATRHIQAGETVTLRAAFAPGALVERRTYGDLEHLSGVIMGPPRTNLILTPSPTGPADTDVGDWQVDWNGTPPAYTVEEVRPGEYAFVMTGAATNLTTDMGMEHPNVPGVPEYEVEEGHDYLFMASTEAKTTPVPAYLRVVWYDASSVAISTDESPHTVNQPSWEQIAHIFTAPTGAVRGHKSIWFDTIASGNGLDPDEEHHVKDVLWEDVTGIEDPLSLPYFSGDTPDTPLVAYEWTGTPRDSASTAVPIDTTYGQLEGFRYYELEAKRDLPTDLYARIRQQGPSDDSFHVHRLALYDSPIAWFFSNDDGITWWQAIDVRNDPFGVLIFPPSDTPEVPEIGRTLRWRAEIYREGATVSSVVIRPWYGTRSHTVARSHGLESIGPNRSVYDDFPATHLHPAWVETFNPIEHIYVEPLAVDDVWRNLVTNPGGEGDNTYPWKEVHGGIIEERFADGPRLGGSFSYRYVSTGDSGPEAYLALGGPDVGTDLGSTHLGAFRIPSPEPGATAPTVSFRGGFAKDADSVEDIWMQMFIQWYRASDDGETLEPVLLEKTGPVYPLEEFYTNASIYRMVPDEVRVTHWRPQFWFYRAHPALDDTQWLLDGALLIDNLYVVSNGKPLGGEPYLDGSQPWGRWDGAPNDSTTTKIPPPLEPPVEVQTVWLDDDLSIPGTGG